MVDILLQKIKENCTNVDLDIVNKAFNLAYEAHKEQKRIRRAIYNSSNRCSSYFSGAWYGY